MKTSKALNIEPADVYPKATDHIPEMVTLIKTLLAKGIAYKGEDGSIYFSVCKFPDYGKLSHIKVDELKAGARVSQDEYAKEEAQDFALWKAWTPEDGDVFWETELGKGRPGWHIECSAHEHEVPGRNLRHPLRRRRQHVPPPRKRNRPKRSRNRQEIRELLDAQRAPCRSRAKKCPSDSATFTRCATCWPKGYDPIAIRYLLDVRRIIGSNSTSPLKA